jgi:hypothetical protein
VLHLALPSRLKPAAANVVVVESSHPNISPNIDKLVKLVTIHVDCRASGEPQQPCCTFVVLPKNLSGSFDNKPMGSSAERLVRSIAASTSSGVAPGANSTPRVAVTFTYNMRLSTYKASPNRLRTKSCHALHCAVKHATD